MHFQHVFPLFFKDLVLAVQLLDVLVLLDNVLGLGNMFCKVGENKVHSKYSENEGTKPRQNAQKENKLLFLMICSFKMTVLPFSASRSACIFWYLSLAMPLRAFSFCGKKYKVKPLFCLLEHLVGDFPPRRSGATARVFFNLAVCLAFF